MTDVSKFGRGRHPGALKRNFDDANACVTLAHTQINEMKHTTHHSKPFILSRQRNGKAELVEPQTGELVIVPETELGPITEVHLDCVPNLIHFPARPPSFLAELRLRREQYLREVRLKKRRVQRTDKGPSEPGPRKARARKLSPALAEAISHLPPGLQEAFRRSSK